MKKMHIWKKAVALTSIATLAAMSLTACGNKSQDQKPQDQETTAGISEETPEVELNGAKDYTEMVDMYVTAMTEKWDMDQLMENNMSTLIMNYYDQDVDSIGFCPSYDLNHDGNNDLLIGEVWGDEEEPNKVVFAAYTIEDNQVAPIFVSSERCSYYLLELVEDDPLAVNVVCEGSNSASNSFHVEYTVEGTQLNICQAIIYDDSVNEENPWFMSYDSLEAEDAESIDEKEALDIMEANESNFVFPGYLTISQGYFMPDPEWVEETDANSGATDDTYMDFADCLASIYGVQAGTAGSSLRAEAVVEEFTVFVQNYGEALTPEAVQEMASEWIEIMVNENDMDVEDFAMCVEDVIAATEGQEVASMTGYNYVCQGLMDAVNQ